MPRVAQSGRYKGRYMGGSAYGAAFSPNSSIDPTSGVISVSLFVKASMLSGNSVFALTDNDSTNDGDTAWRFNISSTYSFIWTWNNAGSGAAVYNPAQRMQKNKWYHVVCVVKVGATTVTGTIYTDGALVATATMTRDQRAYSRFVLHGNTEFTTRDVVVYEKELTAADVLTIYTSSSGTVPQTPKIKWDREEMTGNINYDSSGNGLNGTGGTLVWSPSVPVQMRTAIDWGARSSVLFDGVDDSISVSNSASLNLSGAMSVAVEFMAKSVTSEKNRFLFARWDFTPKGYYIYIDTNGYLTFGAHDSDWGDNVVLSYKITAYKWTKAGMAVSVSGSTTTIDCFVDGQRVGTKTFTGTVPAITQVMYFGQRNDGDYYHNGFMKSARIWNTALTHAEFIDLHFNNIVPTEGLVLDLPLNEGAGTIAYDQSGNGNHGTITGATWSAEVPPPGPRVPMSGRLQIS